MKRTLLIIVIVLICGSGFAQQTTKKVLFIGNSYTYVNNLPQMTQQVAESMGDQMEWSMSAPGGCTFAGHCSNGSISLIREGGWDVVVLQGQSQEPSWPQEQVEVEVFPYAAQLVAEVYAANPHGGAMFFMTWGHRDGDARNAQYFPILATYEGMDSMLYERYLYMARSNDASVSPVGRVWRRLREEHPEINLYQNDGSHPSIAGTYVAACTFYTMIFHRNPQEIRYNPSLDETTAAVIRNTTKTVVFDSLIFWQRQGTSGIANWDDIPTISLYPNPTSGKICVTRCSPKDLQVFDIQGHLVLQGSDDLSQLPQGVYIVSISRSTGTTRCKVVKQ